MKRPILPGIVLIALDQAVKLAIAGFCAGARIVLISGVLRFGPVKNTYLTWISSIAGYKTPVCLMVAFQIVALALIVLSYRYLTYRAFGRQAMLRLFFSFCAAGVSCSFLDVAFWGGSLDFLGLFDWFVFDIKDLYLDTAAIILTLWAIWYEREKRCGRLPRPKRHAFTVWLREGMPLKRAEDREDPA